MKTYLGWGAVTDKLGLRLGVCNPPLLGARFMSIPVTVVFSPPHGMFILSLQATMLKKSKNKVKRRNTEPNLPLLEATTTATAVDS